MIQCITLAATMDVEALDDLGANRTGNLSGAVAAVVRHDPQTVARCQLRPNALECAANVPFFVMRRD
jgi:hypothetical protein